MDLYVLDGNLNAVDIISEYKSLIWARRYYNIGDCEVYLPATEKALRTLQIGRYIMRRDDRMVCRIRKVELQTDAETGNYLIITGKDAKDLLDQRIVWELVTNDGPVETFVRKLITDSMISPTDSNRTLKKTNGNALLALDTAAGFLEATSEQVSYKNIGEKIRDYCQTYKWGYEIFLDSAQLKFRMYQGTDRSGTVRFSANFDNLAATDYSDDMTNMGNVALIGGEGEGSERIMGMSGDALGIDRYEKFVDAKDLSRTITWAELTRIYPTTAQGGEGRLIHDVATDKMLYELNRVDILVYNLMQLTWLQTNYPGGTFFTQNGQDYYRLTYVFIAEIQSGSSTPAANEPCTIYDLVYYTYLINRGAEKLAEFGEVIAFSGSINPDVTFIYKTDYDLGDIVTISNELGVTAEARIVEVVEVEDENGYRVEPKFEYIKVVSAELPPEIITTESSIALTTEADVILTTEGA